MTTKSNIKWRSILGLILIYIALWFNWSWLWGVLFLFWAVAGILSDMTYFMEPIKKEENPILYWAINISWLLMAIYCFFPLVFPN